MEENNRLRAEIDHYQEREAAVCPEDFSFEEVIKSLRAEVERLTEVCNESNSVCACGCPMSEHDSYEEDGICCGNEEHECIPTCDAILEMLQRLRAEVAHLGAEQPLARATQTLDRVEAMLAAEEVARAANEEVKP